MCAIVVGIFLVLFTSHPSARTVPQKDSQATTQVASVESSPLPKTRPADRKEIASPNNTSRNESQKSEGSIIPVGIRVSLSIENARYELSVAENASVLDVMESAAQQGFVYEKTNYPSLGTFVDSINGRTNKDGYYWFLYINGVSSGTGASQTTLKTGDVIEWKYKRSF